MPDTEVADLADVRTVTFRRHHHEPAVVECLASTTVDVVDDELRGAVSSLRDFLLLEPYARLDPARIKSLLDDVSASLRNRPQAEVAECPGRMLITDESVEHGEHYYVARCDCCGRVAT